MLLFCIFDFVHTSKVRLWPNELGEQIPCGIDHGLVKRTIQRNYLLIIKVICMFLGIVKTKNVCVYSGRQRMCVCSGRQRMCVCVCERERERESRDTRSVDTENTQANVY